MRRAAADAVTNVTIRGLQTAVCVACLGMMMWMRQVGMNLREGKDWKERTDALSIHMFLIWILACRTYSALVRPDAEGRLQSAFGRLQGRAAGL